MPTTVRLDAADEARLDTLVQATGRSKASFIRSMIQRGLAYEEQINGIAGSRLRKLRAFDELVQAVEELPHAEELPIDADYREILGEERMRRFG